MLLSFPNVSSACSYSTMEGDLETPNTGGGGFLPALSCCVFDFQCLQSSCELLINPPYLFVYRFSKLLGLWLGCFFFRGPSDWLLFSLHCFAASGGAWAVFGELVAACKLHEPISWVQKWAGGLR